MAGTKEGAKKASAKILEKYGKISKRGPSPRYQLWATLTDGKITLVGVVTGKGKAERERAELLKLETISDIKLLEA